MSTGTLDEAWAEAEAAINFPKDNPRWRYGTWRLGLEGPWDIEYNGHRPTYRASADPYNATGEGLDSQVEGLGPTPAAALQALAARLREPAHTAAKGKT